jgi:hypothetical protein
MREIVIDTQTTDQECSGVKLSFYETDEVVQSRQLLLGAFVARLMLAAVCVS